jgi:hypothetical protein
MIGCAGFGLIRTRLTYSFLQNWDSIVIVRNVRQVESRARRSGQRIKLRPTPTGSVRSGSKRPTIISSISRGRLNSESEWFCDMIGTVKLVFCVLVCT